MDGRRDVIVLGGGPAGSATALRLARRGWSVTMIERSGYGDVRVGETLPPQICPELQALGLWQRFREDGHLPAYGVRSVWGDNELRDNAYIFNPYGMGWRVDRSRFDALIAQGAESAGAEVCRRARVARCFREATNRWRVEFFADGELKSLKARFLVDATGRSSKLRRLLGAEDRWHDHLVGVVAFYQAEHGGEVEDACTLIEAAEQGWWYSASLPTNQMVVVHMTDLDIYAKWRATGADFWNRQLQRTQHTISRVRRLHQAGRPRLFMAGSHCVERIPDSGWLPVGDAILALDPLCGEGVCTALKTAAAAERIAARLEGESDAMTSYLEETTGWFARYLEQRRRFYSRELRWPGSLFWQRRQGE